MDLNEPRSSNSLIKVQDEDDDEEREEEYGSTNNTEEGSLTSSSLPTGDTFKMLLDCLVREERFPESAEAMDKLTRAEGLQGRLGRVVHGRVGRHDSIQKDSIQKDWRHFEL